MEFSMLYVTYISCPIQNHKSVQCIEIFQQFFGTFYFILSNKINVCKTVNRIYYGLTYVMK